MGSDLARSVGKRVARKRRSLGLSMRDFPGVDKTAICRVEAGTSLPMVDTVILLAKGLGVSIDWLLTGKEPTP